MAAQKMGRYEIIRELGHGGMGAVYLARDPAFDRQVAVKVLPAQLTRDPQFLARFQREAKIIAALEQACIVPVYDYGEDHGQPYIVMRYMSGGTLGERLSQGRMALQDVGRIVHRLADALDEAHAQGIVHRDLKPGNILFDQRGQAFLSDFGIAKLMEANSALTSTGMVGTPAYMSPEQAEGNANVDRRSDVYSLGLIVYEMLSGRHPYTADTPISMMYKQIHEMPTPLDTATLGLPAVTRAVVTRALAKKPDERYPTAGEFARYLSGLQSGHLPSASSKPIAPPPQPPTQPVAAPPVPASTVSATRPPQRWSFWTLGLISVPLIAALICGVAALALNPFGNRATPTPMATRTQRPTDTSAPPSRTPPPTNTALPPTATPTETTAPTITRTPTPLPSATNTLAPLPTTRPATRVPATSTIAPLPTNTFVPPTATAAPPTDVPPPPPVTPPTITPVPEPPTVTPVP